jgi:flagellar basal-body rod protein FlgB
MSINDLPVLSALRTKMQWHQERQRVLSDNAGAATGSMGALAMMRTTTSHIAPASGGQTFAQNGTGGFQTRPTGNAVNLEDQMLKVSANQMDYAAVSALYSKSLHMLKVAIGKA